MQYYRNPKNLMSRRERVGRRRSVTGVILLSRLLRFIFFALLTGFVSLFFYFLWVGRELPSPGRLSAAGVRDSTKILDKNGVILYSIYKDINRIYIPLGDVPKHLQDATIVTEDITFYENQGFSLRGYARAIKDFLLYKKVTGGSTITQQLVKNILLTPERSLQRKIKEFILAIQVERRFTKNEILEMYLNNVSFGGTAVGVEAAADMYFSKHAKDLTLAESAFLAGLPQAPSRYSPFAGKDKIYVGRSDHVLKRLEEEGYIKGEQQDKALEEVKFFKFARKTGSIKAPHFVMYVRDLLINELGFSESIIDNGGLVVKTTLNYDIQKESEKILSEELDKIKGLQVGNGAAVILDAKTGGILAMVGSRDYFDTDNQGNFNAATAHRQPGSAMKPLMYAVAFEKGYTPSTLIMDAPTEFPTLDEKNPIYKPTNYDNKYRGPVQIRFALGNSINLPAVKMLARVGIKPVMQKAYDAGIESWKPTDENLSKVGLSLVLGGREVSLLEITRAFSVFANRGERREAYTISEVRDSKDKVLYKQKEKKPVRVFSPEVSFLVSHVLLDNNARREVFGTNSWLVVPGKTVSAKTGTTDQKRDNWTIGYTPSFVVGIWVGNNDNSPMNPKVTSGVTGAAPIWNRIMRLMLRDKKDEQFDKPDNVTALEIGAFGGGLPVEGQARRSEFYIKGTEPTTKSTIYKKVKLSKHEEGKLANQEEIDRDDYDTKEYIVFDESDPVSTDGKNRWREGIDAWIREHYSAENIQYYPPTEVSTYKYEEARVSPTPTPTLIPDFTPSPTATPSP